MAIAVPSLVPFLEDAELATRAADGDGRAFAELYDRHERRVYGFCLRLLGSPHDAADATQDAFVRVLARLPALRGREVNFVAYALTCARNACYDMIKARQRVEPVQGEPQAPRDEPGQVTEDPERAALLASTRAGVQAANARLATRQREVLSLREIELLSYDEIGEIMDLNRNAVAQLVSRARIRLREELRGDALASVRTSSPDCERALPLLAALQDGERAAPGEVEWARRHLQTCETCRVSRDAMHEAGVSYRALGGLVPLVWLRHATIARAADFLGVDWGDVAGPAPRLERLPHPRTAVSTRFGRPLTVAGRGGSAWGRAAAGVFASAIALVAAVVLASRIAPDPSAGRAATPALVRAVTPVVTRRLHRAGAGVRHRRQGSRRAAHPSAPLPGAAPATTTTAPPVAGPPSGPGTIATQPGPRPARRPVLERPMMRRARVVVTPPPTQAPAPTVTVTSTQTASSPPPAVTPTTGSPGGGAGPGSSSTTSTSSSGSSTSPGAGGSSGGGSGPSTGGGSGSTGGGPGGSAPGRPGVPGGIRAPGGTSFAGGGSSPTLY